MTHLGWTLAIFFLKQRELYLPWTVPQGRAVPHAPTSCWSQWRRDKCSSSSGPFPEATRWLLCSLKRHQHVVTAESLPFQVRVDPALRS